ncbi:MAG: UDP-N-acetylmuramoyl-tripeptide--D-alanyl-D-alanine ligase [Gammaproteobacteria bacterium]|nr:UDP-N-acetylmuramoyl-tripeptide--D-alanyl-D-alanine ligase [Gammaproteobacteria bacterium]
MDNWLRLSDVADMTQGELYGSDVIVSAISTDTRNMHKGDLFVALEGDRFDGHEFIDESVEETVQAVLVHKQVNTKLPQVLVDDTLKSLSRWAQTWRHRVDPKLVAVTGSNGKTTVKQMLSDVLALAGSTCFTQGNLNNHIGVPLTLLTLRKHNKFAVIEMGANHFGEIDHLSRLAQPDVVVITNAGPAHLEGFGSIAGVAQAKGEIINGAKSSGVVVLNADDKFLDVWLEKAKHLKIVTFGFSEKAQVCGEITANKNLLVRVNGEKLEIKLPLPGKHNASNALAVIAAARELGVDLQDIKRGLESAHHVNGRLQSKIGIAGATIIDDTYNANPASLQAAIDVLCSQNKEPWLVLGDMGELGDKAEAIHAEIGAGAKLAGVKKLFGLGELAKHAVNGFGDNGFHFYQHSELSGSLRRQVNSQCCILVKGSRAMHMEDVVNFLIDNQTIH